MQPSMNFRFAKDAFHKIIAPTENLVNIKNITIVKMIANGAQARVLTLSDSGKLKGPV